MKYSGVQLVSKVGKRIISGARRSGLVLVAMLLVFAGGVGVGDQGYLNRWLHRNSKAVATNAPNSLDYASVERVYDKIRAEYDGQIDSAKLMDGLKEGLAQATGDPYTQFFNATDAKDFNNQLSGTFSGIGAELGKDDSGNVIVISPLAGYPAEAAGLKSQDVIAAVDDATAAGQSVDQVVKKIRGQTGTDVTLKIVRGGTRALTLKITRAEIKIASVKHSILDGNIGYLQITRFGDDTVSLAQTAADEFVAAKVKGVILDLRSDPGGLVNAAVGVSSLWLQNGQTIFLEKRGDVVDKTFTVSNSSSPLHDFKTAVLINEGSASASEITAGALRDNHQAMLIGTKSFGKGSVQQLEDLGDGSMLKVTIAHWFTPSGKGINKVGIEPDTKVELTDDDAKNSRDPQKDAAIQFVQN